MSQFLDVIVRQLDIENKKRFPHKYSSSDRLRNAREMLAFDAYQETNLDYIVKTYGRSQKDYPPRVKTYLQYFAMMAPVFCHENYVPLYLTLSEDLADSFSGMKADIARYDDILDEHKTVYIEVPRFTFVTHELELRALVLRDMGYSAPLNVTNGWLKTDFVHTRDRRYLGVGLFTQIGRSECVFRVMWERSRDAVMMCSVDELSTGRPFEDVGMLINLSDLVMTYYRCAPDSARVVLTRRGHSVIVDMHSRTSQGGVSQFPFIYMKCVEDQTFFAEVCGFCTAS
jgi:hypothetical protein